jgi:hypothetical protein
LTAEPSLLVLRSERLLAIVDPRHGAEILELLDVERARRVLGHPGFAPIDAVAGDLDEETWIRSYRGGWQMIAPNTGNACVVNGDRHGFQGSSSTSPWRVVEAGTAAAAFAWSGHGLAFERRIELVDDRVDVTVVIEALKERTPLAIVEHVGFGVSLLDPHVELEVPGGRAFEFSEETGPAVPPDDAGAWPVGRMLDGTERRCDRWSAAEPDFALISVADVAEGWATLTNVERDVGVELRWDVELLPNLWIWHEERATVPFFRQATEMLALEPASTPHSLGLAEAISHGQALWVKPGEPRTYGCGLRILRPSSSREGRDGRVEGRVRRTMGRSRDRGERRRDVQDDSVGERWFRER